MAVTGLERANSLLITTGKPVEAKYGPFTDLNTPGLPAAALIAAGQINTAIRFKGLTVGLFSTSAAGVAGPIVEYWFENGTADADLVLKSGGGGAIEVEYFDYSDNGSGSPIGLTSLTTALEGLQIPTNTAGGGLKATATGNVVELNTIFDSQLLPTTTVKPGGVGGISQTTTVADLTTLTLTQLFNKLLFPTQLPVYTIPTSTIGALSVSPSPVSGAYEPGTLITPSASCSFKTNDAGDITGEIIMQQKLGSASYVNVPLNQHGTQTSTQSSPLANQFNLTPANSNNPVITYTRSGDPTQYAITAPQIVNGTQLNSATDFYRSTVGYLAGDALRDSSGATDTRSPAVRSTSAPQSGVSANTFVSSTQSVLSRYPWYYYYQSGANGVAAPTPAQFISIIEAGTNANLYKNMTASNGTLSLLNYGTGSPLYTCVAYPFLPSGGNNFVEKLGFFLQAGQNQGSILSIFDPSTTANISPNGATWSGIQYKIHITKDGFPQSGNISPLKLTNSATGN